MTANGSGFIAGTSVHTKEGLKPIENIRAGDWVLSRPKTSESGTAASYKQVSKAIRHENQEVVRFWWERSNNVGGSTNWDSAYVVPSHQVWLNPNGWVAMGRLHLPGKRRPETIHRGDDEWLGRELVLGNGSTGAMLDVFDLYRTDRSSVAFHEEEGWGLGTLTDFSSVPPSFGDELPYDYEKWGDPVHETRKRYATTVYDLEVEDGNTYFVGKSGLWVRGANLGSASPST